MRFFALIALVLQIGSGGSLYAQYSGDSFSRLRSNDMGKLIFNYLDRAGNLDHVFEIGDKECIQYNTYIITTFITIYKY